MQIRPYLTKSVDHKWAHPTKTSLEKLNSTKSDWERPNQIWSQQLDSNLRQQKTSEHKKFRENPTKPDQNHLKLNQLIKISKPNQNFPYDGGFANLF